jgi:hypothetical protein
MRDRRKNIEQIELVDTKVIERLRNEQNSPEEQYPIGIHRLLKNDLFLGVLLLTFINALIFVYYVVSKQDWISPKEAAEEVIIFTDRVPEASKIKSIVNLNGKFYTKESPEFLAATRNLQLNYDQLTDSNGGIIYQSTLKQELP